MNRERFNFRLNRDIRMWVKLKIPVIYIRIKVSENIVKKANIRLNMKTWTNSFYIDYG